MLLFFFLKKKGWICVCRGIENREHPPLGDEHARSKTAAAAALRSAHRKCLNRKSEIKKRGNIYGGIVELPFNCRVSCFVFFFCSPMNRETHE